VNSNFLTGKAALLATSLFLMTASTPALARCEWPLVRMAVDEGNTAVRRIKTASSLDEAQTYARRFQSAMEDAAMQMLMCECILVQSEFDDAETYSRRAKNASDGDDFVHQMNRAIRSFNAAVDAINMRVC